MKCSSGEYISCNSGELILYSVKKGDSKWFGCNKAATRFWKLGIEKNLNVFAYCDEHEIDSMNAIRDEATELTEDEFLVWTVMLA